MEEFFIKALIAGIGIGISTSLLGIFILWKRMAYLGDSIAHSSILGIGLAAIFSLQPILGILIFALTFAFLVNFLDRSKIYSRNTIIGIISYGFLAVGLILIALFPQSANLQNYLFGDVVLVSNQDLIFIYLNSALIILAFIFYFKPLLLSTINEDLAIIKKINVGRLNLKFLLLTSLTIAISIKITGIFLVTAMLILPAAIARNFSKNPMQMLIFAIINSLIGVITGLYASLYFNFPASGAIIAILVLIFFVTTIFRNLFILRKLF